MSTTEFIKVIGIMVSVICFGVSIFQLLLALGLPIGEYAWGGRYKILPSKLRISSIISFFLLNVIGVIYLANVDIFKTKLEFFNNKLWIWIFVIFFGFNTLGNILSKSKKEKMIMTPITAIVTIASVIIAIGLQ